MAIKPWAEQASTEGQLGYWAQHLIFMFFSSFLAVGGGARWDSKLWCARGSKFWYARELIWGCLAAYKIFIVS